MRQRMANQWHANETLLGRFNRLLNSDRNFASFAGTKTDVAGLVANHYQSSERQILAALDHFGNAVNGNNLIFQIQSLRRNTMSGLSHCSTSIASELLLPDCLEDRKSTRLNSSHSQISYAVFCLKKKKK